jgi:hypothetical protein
MSFIQLLKIFLLLYVFCTFVVFTELTVNISTWSHFTSYISISVLYRADPSDRAAAWLLGSRVRFPLTDGCLSLVFICSVVLCRQRPLRRADHSSRGVLPCVLYVWSQKPRKGPYVPFGNDRKINEWMIGIQNMINVRYSTNVANSKLRTETMKRFNTDPKYFLKYCMS